MNGFVALALVGKVNNKVFYVPKTAINPLAAAMEEREAFKNYQSKSIVPGRRKKKSRSTGLATKLVQAAAISLARGHYVIVL